MGGAARALVLYGPCVMLLGWMLDWVVWLLISVWRKNAALLKARLIWEGLRAQTKDEHAHGQCSSYQQFANLDDPGEKASLRSGLRFRHPSGVEL